MEKAELRTAPGIVVEERTEASSDPANAIAEVAELLGYPVAVMASRLDCPELAGNTVATVDGKATPPTRIEGDKLNPAVSVDRPMIDVVEEPTTAI